jgi:lipopolysaccharide/colanic/teichoic acid biosynthesis glycosyltransferase
VLRKTHLDELPNLWAVLRGEMSMVGPRPERPEFVAMLEREVPLYRARLIVAPGLTGWAQVNTEYGDSVEDASTKLEYDLYYVRHRSFGVDVGILMRTVGRMLGWKGR